MYSSIIISAGISLIKISKAEITGFHSSVYFPKKKKFVCHAKCDRWNPENIKERA
jgi:hypothetical protein